MIAVGLPLLLVAAAFFVDVRPAACTVEVTATFAVIFRKGLPSSVARVSNP